MKKKVSIPLMIFVGVQCLFSQNDTTRNAIDLNSALRSEKDQFGIPKEMYELDRKLKIYKKNIFNEVRSNKNSGTAMIAGGVLGIVVSVVLLNVATKNAKEADRLKNTPGVLVVNDPSPMQYTLGVTDGLFSVFIFGFGIHKINKKPNTSYMIKYYKDKYGQ
jgi:hypothetical protein